MPTKAQIKQEQEWRREEDARTLVLAETILQDRKRLAEARRQIQQNLKTEAASLETMKKAVARKPVKKKKTAKKKKG